MVNTLAGTGSLIRLILRRDRIRIPVWIGAIALFLLSSVSSFPEVYGSAAARQARAALMNNPATVVLTGPGYGLDTYTYGAMTANEMGGFTAVAFAFMGILLFVRHTRAEEESGRAELVGATVVGRYAPMSAALIVVVGTNLLAGAVLAFGLPLALPQLGVPGSLLFGAAVAAVGITFTAVAAVTSQLMEHSRAATGLAAALIAVAFALRAAGDLSDSSPGSGFLSWLSPIGWAQATRVYVDGRWWPLLLTAGLSALLFAVAYMLRARRDEGAGWVRAKPGRATATPALSGSLGLAFRLQRGTLIGWAVGFGLFGLFVGAIAEQAARFIASNETAQRYFAQFGAESSTESMIATYMAMAAMVGTGYALQAVALLRSEETSGRLEQLLGGIPLPRMRWVGSILLSTLAGSVLVVGAAGLGAGLVYAGTSGDFGTMPRVLGAALVHLPAIWVLVGLAIALFGLAPRAMGLGWAALVGVIFVGVFGPLLRLPEWVSELSPFTHTPQLPVAEFTAGPLAVLTVLAAALVLAGVAGFRHRDVG
ncbi:ABC transporter permease [Haloactinomyces albus]|uniref:ABC-2 type transport system permease protein n=1 Tax=Haloactinomyces albus TaxID=1352928 RepID=A0AAE3ZCU9_9ACTN|nr:hypothetical protein [Haloactinomyces albus]MDR7302582.1 ABC-2 type transport system permease protein [Haloactinomyces albus]